MDRLSHVVIFTGNLEGMKRFYELSGLTIRNDTPEWVEFNTAGATLALHAMPDPGRHGIQLRFATDDIHARGRELEERGTQFDAPGIQRHAWGAIASLWDPEGRNLTIWQPAHAPPPAGNGPLLSVVVNCRDMEAMKTYYRDTLGLPMTTDSPWWVQFSAGLAGLGLHPRIERGNGEDHHARDVTVGLAIPDLAEWYEDARARGLAFAGPPHDRGFGTFTDATDPDGNRVTFRDVPDAESLEEQLAEPFEAEEVPHRAAIRKPVRKGVKAKATSRVAVRPEYRSPKRATKVGRPSKPLSEVASPRGTGPAGTRMKPKVKHDPKRARTKPAIGRLRKAERRTLESKKVSVAVDSKSKPVKRASPVRTPKRTAARSRAGR